MLKTLALACMALFAAALAYVPTEASAHGWRAHHYRPHCHRCYRPVRWTCHRCYRPCHRCYRPCHRRYWPEDPAAHLVRPLVYASDVPVVRVRYWGFWGRWWW